MVGSKALVGMVLVMAFAWGPSAQAATRCEPSSQPGFERCVSGLAKAAIDAMAQTQRASQWCWAASISMVLRSHGIDVPQEQVVREQYGAAADVPATGADITALLNRSWRDRSGRVAHLAAGSVTAQAARLSSPDVLADMDDERPVVLVLPRHAVVLVRVEFERAVDARRGAGEPRILNALVLDPRLDQPRPLQPNAAIVHMTRAAGERGEALAVSQQGTTVARR